MDCHCFPGARRVVGVWPLDCLHSVSAHVSRSRVFHSRVNRSSDKMINIKNTHKTVYVYRTTTRAACKRLCASTIRHLINIHIHNTEYRMRALYYLWTNYIHNHDI